VTDADGPAAGGPLVAVIDYGIGNLRSAEKALQRVGADARLTDDRDLIAEADGVVLPGVGAFGRCMEELRSRSLDAVALDAVASGRPFLGICIGMQMLYKGSEESPGVDGLAVLDGVVRRLPEGVKHPQMQWNVVDIERQSHLFDGLDAPAWMYFVHSFAPDDQANAVATCQYGGRVCAAVERDNVWATQFHPEKSSANGLRLLENFVTAAAA
jgi:imidazole glycerol-phosphate synthase subunit HisH